MQLRSGRSTLRRDSRNYEEFIERKKYQQKQKKIEETIYEEEDNNQEKKLAQKMDHVRKRTRHLLYLNKYQQENNSSYSQKVTTIMEIYDLYRYNIDYIIEYYTTIMKEDIRFPEAIYKRGIKIIFEMDKGRRTRQDTKLYKEGKELILFVMDLIYEYILK